MKIFSVFALAVAKNSLEILEKGVDVLKKNSVGSKEKDAWIKMAKSVIRMAEENININPDFDEIIRRGSVLTPALSWLDIIQAVGMDSGNFLVETSVIESV